MRFRPINGKHSLVFFGIAGSGKGAVAKMAAEHGYRPISSGDLLRGDNTCPPEILSEASLEEGERAWRLVKNRFFEIGQERKFVFDGYPRTVEQCGIIYQFLQEVGHAFTLVEIFTFTGEAKRRILKDPKRKNRTDNDKIDARHIEDFQNIASMKAFWKEKGVTSHLIDNNKTLENVRGQLETLLMVEGRRLTKGVFVEVGKPLPNTILV